MSRALLSAWEKVLRRHARDRAVVMAADGQSATFRELDERADTWLKANAPHASALAGQAVVFALPNGLDWLAVLLGLLKANAVAVPLDPGEPPAAQRRMAESLHAGYWWDGKRLVPLLGAKRYRDPAISLVKLTSGSTGAPRPLPFTGTQLLADGRQVTAMMGIRSGDLNYALIPFGHSYGLGNLVVPLLAGGVPVVCGSAPLPHAIAEDFARWRPTVFPSVPAIWRALVAADVALDSLRLAISAGAPLPPETAREFAARFGRRLHAFYGSSETGGIAFDRAGDATLAGGVGRAMRDVRLTVLPGQRLRVCSAAVITHGNRRRAGKFGCWVMQDRVALDARGGLQLLGRRGTMVKVAGRRIDLNEVATRLRRLTGVRDVWVGMSADAEPVLGAAVATDRTIADLRAELLTDTAPWKIPKRLLVLETLPLTARGKPDSRELQRMLFSEAARRAASQA